MIKIGIPARKLKLELGEEDIRKRLGSWKKPDPKITKGYLTQFAK